MQVPLTALNRFIHKYFNIDRRQHASRDRPVTLYRQRIFILPTRFGLYFMLLLILMLVGSTNYSNNLGYLLTFTLASMGVVSIVHTYLNMARLSLRAGKVASVFCGDEARFSILIDNQIGPARHDITLRCGDRTPLIIDVAARDTTPTELRIPATRRGWLPLTHLRIASTYPLGLLRAWSDLSIKMVCLVYPRPAGRSLFMDSLTEDNDGDGNDVQHPGNNDFLGFRDYQPGDSPRHLNWKAAAQGRGLMTKQFADSENRNLWFDWHELSELEIEARLSQLCLWIIEAERSGQNYGLKLPGKVFELGRGEQHQHHCLQALAMYRAS